MEESAFLSPPNLQADSPEIISFVLQILLGICKNICIFFPRWNGKKVLKLVFLPFIYPEYLCTSVYKDLSPYF